MFKIEYLFSYNFSFKWMYYVYNEIPLRLIKPRPNSQSP